MQVDYDPSVVSYEQLLRTFWLGHYPNYEETIIQYKSVIFYHNEEQKRQAEQSKAAREAETGAKMYTDILPYSGFYLAEDYHQKYYLRNLPPLLEELKAIYPDINGFTDSTAAARINGYGAGFGDKETLTEEIDSYGLSPEGKTYLLKQTDRPLVPACPLPSAAP